MSKILVHSSINLQLADSGFHPTIKKQIILL
jgi:hypothetical protein